MIKTCIKQKNIFVTYKERREITETDMINIMEKYGTIKRLKVQNNIHTNNSTKGNSRRKSVSWMEGFTLQTQNTGKSRRRLK